MAYATTTYVAIAAIAAAAASAYVSAGTSQAQKSIANFNADRAREAAEAENKAAASDAYKQMMIYESEMASNRVYFNTHGVRIDEGTPTYTLENQAGIRGINVAAIRMRGAAEATSLMNRASVMEAEGRVAGRAGAWNAGATLLSGAAKAYGYYDSGKK